MKKQSDSLIKFFSNNSQCKVLLIFRILKKLNPQFLYFRNKGFILINAGCNFQKIQQTLPAPSHLEKTDFLLSAT